MLSVRRSPVLILSYNVLMPLDRLDERKRRKDFILERNLLYADPFEKSLSPEEKEIYMRFKVFARYHSREEHEALLHRIIKEHHIMKRIDDLKVRKILYFLILFYFLIFVDYISERIDHVADSAPYAGCPSCRVSNRSRSKQIYRTEEEEGK